MKKWRYIIFVAAATFALSACVKDKLYDTDHPDMAEIVSIGADWSDCAGNAPQPCTINIGSFTTNLDEGTTLSQLFAPGMYNIQLHNTAEGITVNGTTATTVADDEADASSNNPTDMPFVTPLPGWFYTSVMDTLLNKDTDYYLTAYMHQQVRQLTVKLKLTGDATEMVENITAILTGVAGSMDFVRETYSNASRVSLSFTKGADGYWTATTRLLGIIGDAQGFSGSIQYRQGRLEDTPFTSDLSTQLKGFNEDKKSPLTLDGELVETATNAGMIATINAWKVVDGGDHIAE